MFCLSDLFAFSIGCYIIWIVVAGTRYSVDYIKTHRVHVLVLQIWKWCAIILKSSALLSIWVGKCYSKCFFHCFCGLCVFPWLAFVYVDLYHPSAYWPLVWASGDCATEGACGWKPSFSPVSGLGFRPYIPEDLDSLGIAKLYISHLRHALHVNLINLDFFFSSIRCLIGVTLVIRI